MKAIIFGILAAAGIAVIAGVALNLTGSTTAERYSSSATRL